MTLKFAVTQPQKNCVGTKLYFFLVVLYVLTFFSIKLKQCEHFKGEMSP